MLSRCKSKPAISIIGTGYVGLCTGAVFAKLGHRTICVDIVEEKVRLINRGKAPIFERGLDEILSKLVAKKILTATSDIRTAVLNTDISFICVGTPSNPDGSIDLKQVRQAAEDIGRALREKKSWHLVVVKSTVLPLTTEMTILPALEQSSGKKAGVDFGLCMNPEFLREGDALHDAFNPDRIVIGELEPKSGDMMMKLYSDFSCAKLRTDLRTAEMIKYVSNAFLATKISFSNEIANICELFGTDVYEVMAGVGLDKRIGRAFLDAGAGFGGSCFPKDVKAFLYAAKTKNYIPKILSTVLEVNETQAAHVVELTEHALGTLKARRVALLGLAFKPGTDDVRESRAVPIAQLLMAKSAEVIAYDPQANKNFHALMPNVKLARSVDDALKDADACIIQTAWDEFRALKPAKLKQLMRTPVVIDARRIFDGKRFAREGVIYKGIGWSKN